MDGVVTDGHSISEPEVPVLGKRAGCGLALVVCWVMVPRSRWRTALNSVSKVERRSSVLQGGRRRHQWVIYGRTAVRQSVDMATLPEVLGPKGEFTHEINASARADAVKVGKFDVDRSVRLRAFYEPAGLSIRLQAGGPRSGVVRTLHAFKHVQRHAPGLMPRIHDDGRLRDSRFLVEESMFGVHPRAGEPLQAVAEELGSGLRRLHEGYGVREQRLSDVLGARFESRWHAAVARYELSDDLCRRVRNLVSQDRLVDVSYGHGDLVGTNIMQVPDRLVLIDWEYSGEVPIAFDVAKVHLHCADPVEAARLLRRGLGRSARINPSQYSFDEQIAIAYARYIAWSSTRWERAEAAGRTPQLNRLIAKRAKLIEAMLDE